MAESNMRIGVNDDKELSEILEQIQAVAKEVGILKQERDQYKQAIEDCLKVIEVDAQAAYGLLKRSLFPVSEFRIKRNSPMR